MPVERFKRMKDAVVDKVGDAKDAVVDKVGDAKDAVVDRVTGATGSVVERVSGAREAVTSRWGPGEDPYADLDPAEAAAARAEDERAARQAELDAKPLRGPAGAYLHGTADGTIESTAMAAVPAPEIPEGATWRQRFAASRAWGKQLEQHILAERARFAPPPPMRDLAARQAIADQERRIRDALRAPYRSPDAWPVVIVRFVVPVDNQIGGVIEALGATGLAARPDLVYGVSRVPDRLSGRRLGSDRDAVVEWEVVHAALEPLTPIGAAPEVVYFAGEEPWVARAAGEPSVLDEDLALAFTTGAGIHPEQTLGVARVVTTDVHNEHGLPTVKAAVRGVVVLHRSQTAAAATERFQALRWMLLPPGPPPGIHVEVLNWRAVAEVVHRQHHELPEIPSRFAYLPSTPDELLIAYLDVVGIWPGDCYSAQITRDQPATLLAARRVGTEDGIDTRVTSYPLPCADGVDRPRAHGTTLVVVAYRDRPAYEEGRARWDAYQRDILHADLRLETGARRPVQDGLHPGVPKVLRGAARAVDTAEKIANWEDQLTFREGADFKPHRYCWPPTTGE